MTRTWPGRQNLGPCAHRADPPSDPHGPSHLPPDPRSRPWREAARRGAGGAEKGRRVGAIATRSARERFAFHPPPYVMATPATQPPATPSLRPPW